MELWDGIKQFFDWISWFLNTGLWQEITNVLAKLVEVLTVGFFTLMYLLFELSWGIAKQILIDLQVSQHIQNAWTALPDSVVQVATLFRLPEVMNNMLTAVVARFVFSLIPFL